jgi:hypothetical protein
MTTIHSNLPVYDAARNPPSLSRSLRNLSESARPAAQQAGDGDAAGAPDARTAVELQNQVSALADPAEAASVNSSASAFIASSPAEAGSAQPLDDAAAVRRLVSED